MRFVAKSGNIGVEPFQQGLETTVAKNYNPCEKSIDSGEPSAKELDSVFKCVVNYAVNQSPLTPSLHAYARALQVDAACQAAVRTALRSSMVNKLAEYDD